jgi:hypothetical protein
VNWTSVASLATAAGTLVLAVATFASVRSANRAARAAERSLQAGLRPLLAPSRPDDGDQEVHFAGGQHVIVPGGRAIVAEETGAILLAVSLRNAGSGLAVLHDWRFYRHDIHGDMRPAPHDFTKPRTISPISPATCTCRSAASGSGRARSAIRRIRPMRRHGRRSRNGTC